MEPAPAEVVEVVEAAAVALPPWVELVHELAGPLPMAQALSALPELLGLPGPLPLPAGRVVSDIR